MKLGQISIRDKNTKIDYHLVYLSQDERDLLEKILERERRGLLEL